MSESAESRGKALPLEEMRALIADLDRPKPWIYWVDFLTSVTLGWGAFAASLMLAPISVLQIILILVSGAALYRGLAFIHEITHLRQDGVPGFRLAWNLLCGVPVLIPDFMYVGIHLVHHTKRGYGTGRDAEYLPFTSRSKGFLLGQVPGLLVLPMMALIRFGLLSPLSLVIPPLRQWVKEHMSAVSMKLPYKRALPSKRTDWRWWRLEETGCSVLVLGVAAGIAAGFLPVALAVHWYLVLVTITLLNFVRAIGATHRYSGDESVMSFSEQFDDSVNVTGSSPLTLIICPVGLRFHALHHLFPALPYHGLGAAHRRLAEALPPDSPYAAASVPGILAGCAQLWRSAGTGAVLPSHAHPVDQTGLSEA
ncbi:MAG: fatty acid desaturase [Pseudomonadota bacterium]